MNEVFPLEIPNGCNGEHMKYANSDEFVERMKCFRKKTSGEAEYLTPVK